MAKTSVYLPDDLAEQARAYGIPVSEVAQAAVRQAVRAAQIKESVMTDIGAVAERLQATRIAAVESAEAKAVRVRKVGADWARADATAAELEYLATYGGSRRDYSTPLSLVFYLDRMVKREHGGRPGLPGPSGVPHGPDQPHWADLQAGAREVWEAVQPLLMEIDGQGGSLPSGSGAATARRSVPSTSFG